MLKNRLKPALAALLLLTLAVPAFVLAQQTQGRRRDNSATAPAQPGGPNARARRAPADATSALEQDFSEALSVIEDNYVDGQKLDYNNTFKSSIIGMLRTLDPHSNYYDAKEFEEMRTDWRSEYYGIGATIGNRTLGDDTDTYILDTFEGSPATKAGLRYGDRLVAVDGMDAHGRPSSEVRDKLLGPRGSTVKVTFERAADGQKQTVSLVRDAVPKPSVPDAYLLKNGVGYIDMTRGFNYTTGDEFQDALDKLHKQGMTALVLDLRNNPGGLLDQAVKVASEFLPTGLPVLSQRGRAYAPHTYRSENANPDNIPLVVLVNRNTASASEIVAGALQDHDRALIIGETSFGKGLVQSIIPLEYGTALTLTSSKYYTPSGRLVQRDYTNEGLYDYYTRGGTLHEDEAAGAPPAEKPVGPESKTDTGRSVYGGGGITPDEPIKPRLLGAVEQRAVNPVFGFVRELVNGRIAGFDSYKVQRAITYDHAVKADEYPVTDELFKAFKTYVAAAPAYKLTDKQLDANREFLARQIRYEIATAAYGTVAAAQVLNVDDPQVVKAVEDLPRARELAAAAMRGRNPQQKSFE
ncbi:MAG TPA: S41 family peptidase [Pyrinomonadaceae bacterium]